MCDAAKFGISPVPNNNRASIIDINSIQIIVTWNRNVSKFIKNKTKQLKLMFLLMSESK